MIYSFFKLVAGVMSLSLFCRFIIRLTKQFFMCFLRMVYEKNIGQDGRRQVFDALGHNKKRLQLLKGLDEKPFFNRLSYQRDLYLKRNRRIYNLGNVSAANQVFAMKIFLFELKTSDIMLE
ncbi:hypothetical protein ACJX0J_038708 [Zea mays]